MSGTPSRKRSLDAPGSELQLLCDSVGCHDANLIEEALRLQRLLKLKMNSAYLSNYMAIEIAADHLRIPINSKALQNSSSVTIQQYKVQLQMCKSVLESSVTRQPSAVSLIDTLALSWGTSFTKESANNILSQYKKYLLKTLSESSLRSVDTNDNVYQAAAFWLALLEEKVRFDKFILYMIDFPLFKFSFVRQRGM
jgi:hypothetical protein